MNAMQRFSAAATKPTLPCPQCGGWVTCTTTRLTADGQYRTRYYSCRSCGYCPHRKRVLPVSRKNTLAPAAATAILERIKATIRQIEEGKR